jgi:hypothetical protein
MAVGRTHAHGGAQRGPTLILFAVMVGALVYNWYDSDEDERDNLQKLGYVGIMIAVLLAVWVITVKLGWRITEWLIGMIDNFATKMELRKRYKRCVAVAASM